MKNTKPAPFRWTTATRTAQEQSYMADLEHCIESSSFSAVEQFMNFPLYVPRQNIANFLVKYELFKRILNVHGSIVECGVAFGAGLMAFAQLSAIFEPVNHQGRIFGFDTFSGFPSLSQNDRKSESREAHRGGCAVDSYNEISRCIRLFDQNRFVGHIPKVELVRGDATKTIPQFIDDNPQLIVRLLYLDFDLYEPTKIAIENFLPRMPKNAIIAFDELNLRDWPGETLAALETLRINNLTLERFPFGSTISFARVG
jgi:hypothetical protein